MTAYALAVIGGYLAGSFPSSYLAGRLFRGIDLRSHGSGNLGATNVFRVLGPAPGVIVLAADVLKGWAPVCVLAPFIASRFGLQESEGWLKIAAGLSAVCGHNWTVFLNFRGGKGVATSAGVMLGMAPLALGFSFLVWLAVTGLTGYVSLGSIVSALGLPFLAHMTGANPEITGFAAAAAVFIIARHRQNIIRLARGRENRFLLRKLRRP